MKLKHLILSILVIMTTHVYSQEDALDSKTIERIQETISYFKDKNIDKISEMIFYPLEREYPIPPIKNNAEFLQRFSEVFDDNLINIIASSDIEQWSEVGWRGVMLDDGIIWMANSDGKISSVNYQSDYEKNYISELIAKEKENLHPSLRSYVKPVYKFKTKRYMIRIDELPDYQYRYASWKIGSSESSKPDIILIDGEWQQLGSGGNHVITFKNENFTYKIYRHIIGDGDSDFTLIVEKDDEEIMSQNGRFITN